MILYLAERYVNWWKKNSREYNQENEKKKISRILKEMKITKTMRKNLVLRSRITLYWEIKKKLSGEIKEMGNKL